MPKDSGIVNAFALGVEANRRRQQVENQLARISLMNDKLTMQNEWKDKEFGFKYDKLALDNQIGRDRLGLAQDRLNNMTDHQSDMTAIASLREERLNDALGITLDKAKGQEDSALMAQNMLADAPAEPGTMGYRSWLNKIKNEVPYSPATKAIFASAEHAHETAARDIQKAQADDFTHTMRLTDMFGGKKEWFQWPDSMWGSAKASDGTPERWVARELSPDKKNVLRYLSPEQEKEIVAAKAKGDKTAQNTVLDYKTINADTYNTIRDGWKRINSTSNDPSRMADQITTYPPVPQSKNQLIQNQVYQTTRGPARWNGATFEPL
jgi:hypothetical protein